MGVTHRCPECRASFGAPAMCRGVGGAHAEEIRALPIVGCEEPPDISYTIILRGVGVRANTRHRAKELAASTVADLFGGDTKRAAWAMERIGHQVEVVPNAPLHAPGRHDPSCVVWEPRL